MKKFFSLVATLLFVIPAQASLLDNVHPTGEIYTIASDLHHNVFNLYQKNGARTRAMAGLSANVWENVRLNTLFQYVYSWGDRNYTNNGFSDAHGMYLANANVEITNLFNALDVTIGRQFYGDEDSAIIYFGPNHYNVESSLYAPVLDAVKAVYHTDTLAVTLLGGKIDDVTSGATNFLTGISPFYVRGTRATILGGDLKWNMTDQLKVQAYGYDVSGLKVHDYETNDTVPLEEYYYTKGIEHVGVYGAKLSWTSDTFRASAEYARNMYGAHAFKERKDTPYMVKADVAQDIGSVTARGTFLYGKEKYGGSYGFAIPFLQMGNYKPGLFIGQLIGNGVFNTIFAYTDGVRLFNVGLDYRPTDKWEVSLDGFSMQDRLGRHSTTLEADLTAKYNYSNNVQLFAGLGYAKYGWSWNRFSYDDSAKIQGGTIIRF